MVEPSLSDIGPPRPHKMHALHSQSAVGAAITVYCFNCTLNASLVPERLDWTTLRRESSCIHLQSQTFWPECRSRRGYGYGYGYGWIPSTRRAPPCLSVLWLPLRIHEESEDRHCRSRSMSETVVRCSVLCAVCTHSTGGRAPLVTTEVDALHGGC